MSEYLIKLVLNAAERGWLPDFLLRRGIRGLCAERLAFEERRQRTHPKAAEELFERMSAGQVAIATEEANEQHYEQPTDLFLHTLGPRLKYSCCYWTEGVTTLAQAEEHALEETCSRARIEDGMDILDLGCGWGSLTLWMAARYPASSITAVSNSASQRAHIEAAARRLGLTNVRVLTANMNRFNIQDQFDRIVSVEMFEHMNNYHELFKRVAGWMRKDGMLFVHVFAHRRYAYKYEPEGAGNWIARNFFTGGVMPSENFLPRFLEHVKLKEQWWWSGTHYRRTAEAWLANMNANRKTLIGILAAAHGRSNARRWYQRWRMFYMACAEMWGYRNGQEWGVAHYLFERRNALESGTPQDLLLAANADRRSA